MAIRRSVFPGYLSSLFHSSKVISCGTLLPLQSSASFSTHHFVGDTPILVRDFIHAALYDPKHGYFSQRSRSVGVLESSINFNKLGGQKAYMQLLDKVYKQNEVSWFTPAELFKPWYAHGIAESILRTANLSVPLKVLDNLPHDIIYSRDQFSPWMEVWVEKQAERSELCELYKPVEDQLISSCMEILDLEKESDGRTSASLVRNVWAKVFPKPRRCWLPTGCLKLLEVLHGALPKMSLIASDFSYLPDVTVPGERAPLVSSKRDGKSFDHKSYMDAKGDADIFFPTDFWLLERMDHHCSGWLKPDQDKSSKKGKKRRTLTLDTSSFMEEFGLPSKTRTKDGYNPLLDDFKNTKIYLSVPTHNTK
ncbi:uncharacterized protein [Coffea arabica]|uniref:Protein arginine methyltransferase NDUFAF7 n=1 Tax=Coffea arabica TaxID=13443 RepID=A0ABM4X9K7_COFAR